MNLKQLAQELSLSQTTVSRALNGYPEVREATRRRVLEAAQHHGYRPNARAQGLATGRARAIGHVLPLPDQHEMVNPIFGDFLAGTGEVCAAHGYDITLTLAQGKSDAQVYGQLASRGSVDGVIVHAPRMEDPRIALLCELGLPFVVHGRASGCALPYSWVDVNNRAAFQRATTLLLDLGHQRIGLINGDARMDFAFRREDGYRSALGTAEISPDPALVFSGEMTEQNGYRAAMEMLERADAPTAFAVASVISGIGVRRALAERNLRLGLDVSVVVFDDQLSYLDTGLAVPLFTCVRSSVRAAGRRCAEILLEQIETPNSPPQGELLDASLIMGHSTGPRRQ